jgi:hypothetical protein
MNFPRVGPPSIDLRQRQLDDIRESINTTYEAVAHAPGVSLLPGADELRRVMARDASTTHLVVIGRRIRQAAQRGDAFLEWDGDLSAKVRQRLAEQGYLVTFQTETRSTGARGEDGNPITHPVEWWRISWEEMVGVHVSRASRRWTP